MKTGAVILAAGAPGEIKEGKPMMCVGRKPMIRHIVDTLTELRLAPIVVVTGYRSDIIERCLASTGATIVRNRKYASTDMFGSLKLGIAALADGCDRAFIFPADMPLVKPETLGQLMSIAAPLVKPSCDSREGHPILMSGELFEAVERYSGDGGLRAMLAGMDTDVRVVPVEDMGVLMDVNSYEEYEQVQAVEARRCGRGKLHAECEILLSVDDVIMNRDTMRLLEMLQYTGSLQLASELMQVPYTRSWRQIKNMERQLGVPIVQSAAGGARGGGSQLTEQGSAILEAYQKMSKECARMANWLFNEYFSDRFVETLQNKS